MKPLEIAKNIYWVGASDWNMRDFHGYSTYQGTSYNAFLVIDEKVALVDTVKKEFADEMISKISAIVDPKRVDLVISNHTEMDHSGGLARIMHLIGEDKPLYCSRMGHKNLSLHFPRKWNYQPVDDGQVLSLGERSIKFFETRMLHWPDSMFSYVQEDALLFSSDAFGQHYAGPERFDDEIGEEIMPHAKKYFANILLPYSPLVIKLVNKLTAAGLPLKTVCPDHGVMWREDPGKIIGAYVDWSKQAPARKAVVVYDTMWHSTETMAREIVDALSGEGVYARPMHLRSVHRSEVMTEVLDAGAVIVGSPTLNNGIFPTVSDFLTYMKGLKPKNKVGASFGSYGWSGESVKILADALEEMKFQVIQPGARVQYIPDDQGLEACRDLASRVAAALPPAV